RLDLRQPLLRQQLGERAMNEANPLLQLHLFTFGRSLERATEVVEDGDELLHEPLVRPLREGCLLTRVSLAEVVELRCEPLQAVEQLVAISLERVDVDALLVRPGRTRGEPPGPPHPPPPPPFAGGRVPGGKDGLLPGGCPGHAL